MMRLRPVILSCVAGLLAAWGTERPIYAQPAYPQKPIRLLVGFVPGGATDLLARVLGKKLSETLGQRIVVDNRPGASGQIGTELVARAAPDGYTILHVDTSFTSNRSLYPKLPYDALRDFAPISLLASAPVVLIVHPSVRMPAVSHRRLVSRRDHLDAGCARPPAARQDARQLRVAPRPQALID